MVSFRPFRGRIRLEPRSEWSHVFDPFIPRVNYGDIKVILTYESVDKTIWCDHSNEPLQQCFHMVLFTFINKYFTKWNLKFVLNFDSGTFGSERVKFKFSDEHPRLFHARVPYRYYDLAIMIILEQNWEERIFNLLLARLKLYLNVQSSQQKEQYKQYVSSEFTTERPECTCMPVFGWNSSQPDSLFLFNISANFRMVYTTVPCSKVYSWTKYSS